MTEEEFLADLTKWISVDTQNATGNREDARIAYAKVLDHLLDTLSPTTSTGDILFTLDKLRRDLNIDEI